MDIDIEGVSIAEGQRFKDEQGGYSGHHTTRLQSTAGHAYAVCICTPKKGKIFDATVTFTVLRKLGFSATTAEYQATLGKVVGPDD